MDGQCKCGLPALSNFRAEATAPALRTGRNALGLPRHHHDAPDDRALQGLPVRRMVSGVKGCVRDARGADGFADSPQPEGNGASARGGGRRSSRHSHQSATKC